MISFVYDHQSRAAFFGTHNQTRFLDFLGELGVLRQETVSYGNWSDLITIRVKTDLTNQGESSARRAQRQS